MKMPLTIEAIAICLLIAIGLCVVTSAHADEQNLELTGVQGGNLGSVTMADIVRMPRSYKEVDPFNETMVEKKKKGKVYIVVDPRQDEVVKLMHSAFDLATEKKYDEALASLQLLDAIECKNADEIFFIQRMRVSIAAAAGDDLLLEKSLQTVIAAKTASAEDELQFIETLSDVYARRRDLPNVIVWTSRYLEKAGGNAGMRTRLARAYYLNGEFAAAAHEFRANIAASELAGRAPEFQDLRLLISAELKSGDQAGYVSAIEKSITYVSKKEDWTELLTKLLSRDEFSEELGLDVYRLMFKTGLFSTAKDFVDMAKLSLVSGFPAESKQVLSAGFASGTLGNGAAAGSHKQLLNVANRRASDKLKELPDEEAGMLKSADGAGLVQIGYVYTTEGQFDKGIKLIEQGIAMGGLKRPDHAKLHLGMAQGAAGRKNDAIQTLKSVQGTDGAAELARYWAIYVARPDT